MATVYVTDARFAAHTLEGHPEHAGRLEAIERHFAREQLHTRLVMPSVTPAPYEALAAAHSAHYLADLEQTRALAEVAMLDPDTYVLPGSYEVARLAAGAVLTAVDAVLASEADNALAAVRPPGHHATRSTAMGFCLLNNIAIAARHAVRVHGLRRVLIVDFDVHHGNGTQDIFYDDPAVLYVSSHQSPLYPGTGMVDEIGVGAGVGYTLNIPLPPGAGDRAFEHVYRNIVVPAATRFAPDLILVSAGFDAHWADPLANMMLSLAGFDRLVRLLTGLAQELCAGRIVFVLEGGYHLEVLGAGWANVARALLGDAEVEDPLGVAHHREPDIETLVARIRRFHKLM